MSIASAIQQLQNAKTAIANAITAKGVPATGHGLSDFATDIASIPEGGADERLLQMLSAGSAGSIDLSDLTSLTKIIAYAFYSEGSARRFTAITLPDSITEIGSYAFFYQETLQTLNLPSTITNLGISAFCSCRELALTSLPDGITSIPTYCFQNCHALLLSSLPSQLQSIKNYAFQNCQHMPLTSLPATLTEIGDRAFDSCQALSIRSFPAALATLGSYAFSDCQGITEIELPSTLTRCSASIFYNCTGLEKAIVCCPTLVYGSSSSTTFRGCTALTKVWISEDCTSIKASSYSGSPFYECSHLTDIYCEATSKPSGWGNYWNYRASSTPITVHWGVSRAEAEAIWEGNT